MLNARCSSTSSTFNTCTKCSPWHCGCQLGPEQCCASPWPAARKLPAPRLAPAPLAGPLSCVRLRLVRFATASAGLAVRLQTVMLLSQALCVHLAPQLSHAAMHQSRLHACSRRQCMHVLTRTTFLRQSLWCTCKRVLSSVLCPSDAFRAEYCARWWLTSLPMKAMVPTRHMNRKPATIGDMFLSCLVHCPFFLQ